VQVVRDITERHQYSKERETLLFNLGERLKELRCLQEIAELTQSATMTVPNFLAEVVRLLPPAFVQPQQVQAAIGSDWGYFGVDLPDKMPERLLEVGVFLNHKPVGKISVWYPDEAADTQTQFLSEESVLLANVANQIGQTISRLYQTERVQRLTALYELLSGINRAMVHCHTLEELLDSIFEALCLHGTFQMLFLAVQEQEFSGLQLLYQQGIPPEQNHQLQQVLMRRLTNDSDSFDDLKRGKIIHQPRSTEPTGMPEQASWQALLHQQGITDWAVLPLLRNGKFLGLVGVFTAGLTGLDAEHMRLLEEIKSDMCFALDQLENNLLKFKAEILARRAEQRFRAVFDASPIPMQLVDIQSGQVNHLNQAHHDWLGYASEDIRTSEEWFEKAFPEIAVRAELREHWKNSVIQARIGKTVTSPELVLTGKNGRQHQAYGVMSVVENTAIVAWIDLTQTRRQETALRESEQRFRRMVEQSVSGMYALRAGQFIYVNPRFCQMLDFAPHELLGHDILEFTDTDAQNVERMHQAGKEMMQKLPPSFDYCFAFRKKNGSQMEMVITGQPITWDDGAPALILMAQDVTERKRAETQIANYVKQLEGSMRATLEAVSNMLEMRDPYTAAHERRVGLIASAIARELGWDDKRCEMLELLGLVHDIGKIAVPAEILSKPTRLTSVEMTLIKGHAQIGYDILKNVPYLMPEVEVIRQHHERMDGSGYPQGLKGDEIMPEARVLAVADVLESMSSHRPYRPALGLAAAVAEIIKGRGLIYDAEVVDAAVRLIHDKNYVLPV